jgi:hypothetical protein
MKNTDYLIFALIIGVIIVPILIAYFRDFKDNPKEFESSLKSVTKGIAKLLAMALLFFGINKIYELLIPINKNQGIEFNAERVKIGLPILEKNWEKYDYESEQFKTIWCEPQPSKGHFKKIIEYGILGLKSETDYYKNENLKETFAWSTYNFDNGKFEYFLEKPNEIMVSVTEKGNLKMEDPTVVYKINKEEFEKYISN